MAADNVVAFASLPYSEAKAREPMFEATTDYFLERSIHPLYLQNDVKLHVTRSKGYPFVIPFFEPGGRKLLLETDKGKLIEFALQRVWRNDANPKQKFKQPAGTKPQLYFAPLRGVKLSKACSDAGVPLVICEGPVKAMAVAQHGEYLAIGISGCWGWQSKGTPCPTWSDVQLEGREVFVITDADVHTNPDVLRANLGLSRFLKKRGAAVKMVPLPEVGDDQKAGLDDYVAAHGYAAFKALLEDATEDELVPAVNREDLLSYLPDHQYIFLPTGALWPASAILAVFSKRDKQWLDLQRPVHAMTWAPGEDKLIKDRVLEHGGWREHEGIVTFNQYRPPEQLTASRFKATRWLDHGKAVFGEDWPHMLRWFAYRVQNPGKKINHALVLGSPPGGGKDTLLDPVHYAVGRHNAQAISAATLLADFNSFAQTVLLQVSEARDLGESNRITFYEHSKDYIAAPPLAIRVNQKHVKPYYVPNVTGVVITTNHRTGALFLPEDDRRHFVAWSESSVEKLGERYYEELWSWYAAGGYDAIASYLRSADVSRFNPAAPPPKTEAFWSMAHAERNPDETELAEAIEFLGSPGCLTTRLLLNAAIDQKLVDLVDTLSDGHGQRSLPHKLERAGYVAVRNPDDRRGYWRVASESGRISRIYVSTRVSGTQAVRLARQFSKRK